MLSLYENTAILGEVCVAGATLGIFYNLVAAILVLRFIKQPTKPDMLRPPQVSILKPLHGGEPGLYRRLAAFCHQDYPEEVQLVCGTQQSGDHAIHPVRLLQRLNPDAQIDLIVDERSRGSNRKVGNLVNMEVSARHELVVLSDSDIVVDDQFVQRIAAELERSQAGAVTCVYYGIGLGGVWARLSALNINCQFLPNVIMALTFGAAKPCFGSAIALRKDTLKRIGGLAAFLEELADDYAIGKAVRAAGLEVVIPRWAVGHACFERNLRSFWEHHMRSARTIRSIDPIGYVGLLFMHPLMLSVLAALTGASYPLVLMTSALSARALLNATVERTFDLQRQSVWLLALHDAVSFAVYVCSFFGTSVTWRGYNFHILRDGTIEENDLMPQPRRSDE
jgi:ceramide glucosyltransferase